MKLRLTGPRRFHIQALTYLMAGSVLIGALEQGVRSAPETTKAQAITRVRSILNHNAGACRIKKIQSVLAVRSRGGWRVTAKVVMTASGSPLSETTVWTVRLYDRKAVPNNQLTSEISAGCP